MCWSKEKSGPRIAASSLLQEMTTGSLFDVCGSHSQHSLFQVTFYYRSWVLFAMWAGLKEFAIHSLSLTVEVVFLIW